VPPLPGLDLSGRVSQSVALGCHVRRFQRIGAPARYPLQTSKNRNYIVSVPLFAKVRLMVNDHATVSIIKPNSGTTITSIRHAGRKLDGYFISHHELMPGGGLVITTR